MLRYEYDKYNGKAVAAMTYSELIAMVYAAKQIGTFEAKKSAIGYIFASFSLKTINAKQKDDLLGKLRK